jgi:hypothetical protein
MLQQNGATMHPASLGSAVRIYCVTHDTVQISRIFFIPH